MLKRKLVNRKIGQKRVNKIKMERQRDGKYKKVDKRQIVYKGEI